jgi:V/A-type H+-transporting ATPase subunit A
MSDAIITRISGPVLHATVDGPFFINEAVKVGPQDLLGEVMRLNGDNIVVQVYEDTSGVRPGITVTGTGHPLSIRLGPGLLGNIFDGLLRPLAGTGSHYVQPGMHRIETIRYQFSPEASIGQSVDGGAVIGTARPDRGRSQFCLLPPALGGKILEIAPEGAYTDDHPVCTVSTFDGQRQQVAMSHLWPVRSPRPARRRLPIDGPMLTGQRVLDGLFPIARGGKAAMPGGFGTGKTILQEALAKWCDADIIVYVGCGERGNEMAGVLHEFPELEDPRTGRPLMERTVIIANTSNMPVAAREASIYTGVTVAEYFRDQGLQVALMADSTSRWAEALREVSGRLGELPGESGYPAYLSSRQAEFYERAARVTALCGREGSVTIIGSVSPPSADFSEPVTTHTKRYVRCFWVLDRARAHARFYPAIHPLESYSDDAQALESWWETRGNSQWRERRRRFLEILEQQAHLERMARIVGKDALPAEKQLTLLSAHLINEGFLRQSALSPTDRYASPERQTAMMHVLYLFIERAERAIREGMAVEQIASLPVVRRLQRMGEEITEDRLQIFDELATELDEQFATLGSGESDAA